MGCFVCEVLELFFLKMATLELSFGEPSSQQQQQQQSDQQKGCSSLLLWPGALTFPVNGCVNSCCKDWRIGDGGVELKEHVKWLNCRGYFFGFWGFCFLFLCFCLPYRIGHQPYNDPKHILYKIPKPVYKLQS